MIAATLLLSGCFRQDYSDCTYPDNLKLTLNLTVEGGAGSLNEKVNRLDLFIYDVDGQQVAYREVRKESEDSFQEQAFTLESGEYHIVCWGNITEETKIVGVDEKLPFQECYLETISEVTASPLYYAFDPPARDYYRVLVPHNEEVAKEMTFIRAHRTIRVYLRSYEKMYGESAPKIRLVGMPSSLDFYMHPGRLRKIHESTPTKVKTDNEDRMMVSFNTMLAPLDDEMLVEIVNESGGVVTTINLKDYVEKKILEIDDLNELNIEVLYLMDGSVEISVVDWEDIPLEPEW